MVKTIGLLLTLCVLAMVGNSSQNSYCLPEGPKVFEEYRDDKCVDLTCEAPDLHINCDDEGLECRPAYYCKYGYVRNELRECVPSHICLNIVEGHENEVYWFNHIGPELSCPGVIPKCEERGWFCKFGLLRNHNNECVENCFHHELPCDR